MKKFRHIMLAVLALALSLSACTSLPVQPTESAATETLSSMQTEAETAAPTEPVETVPPTETDPPEEEITFTCEFVQPYKMMPYALFTPSSAESGEPIPLIVWLHGVGERNVYTETFMSRGLPGVLNEWTLDGFNAYVICPQLLGKWGYKQWNFYLARDELQKTLDAFISEHNVDTDRIILMGHSLGSQGAMYMAHQLPEYFSKLVVMSGYHPIVDFSEITIPTVGYVGTLEAGEEKSSIRFMNEYFVPVFGEENVYVLEASHVDLPGAVMNQDEDQDGKSDLIEWILDME